MSGTDTRAGSAGAGRFAALDEGAEVAAGAAAATAPGGAPPSARLRIAVGAAIVLVVLALVASVLITALTPVGATTVLTASSPADRSPTAASGMSSPGEPPPQDAGNAISVPAETPSSTPPIMVHVLGAVAHPGVFELASGSRVVDAVARAGGFAESAEQGSVNLARPLVDGEQLRVLAAGEAAPPAPPAPQVPGSAGASATGAAPDGSANAAPASPIDLNAATPADLDTLPRIGPAMAARIIQWRDDNGPFRSVDDLLQVTGIGEKTFDSLRDLVRV